MMEWASPTTILLDTSSSYDGSSTSFLSCGTTSGDRSPDNCPRSPNRGPQGGLVKIFPAVDVLTPDERIRLSQGLVILKSGQQPFLPEWPETWDFLLSGVRAEDLSFEGYEFGVKQRAQHEVEVTGGSQSESTVKYFEQVQDGLEPASSMSSPQVERAAAWLGVIELISDVIARQQSSGLKNTLSVQGFVLGPMATLVDSGLPFSLWPRFTLLLWNVMERYGRVLKGEPCAGSMELRQLCRGIIRSLLEDSDALKIHANACLHILFRQFYGEVVGGEELSAMLTLVLMEALEAGMQQPQMGSKKLQSLSWGGDVPVEQGKGGFRFKNVASVRAGAAGFSASPAHGSDSAAGTASLAVETATPVAVAEGSRSSARVGAASVRGEEGATALSFPQHADSLLGLDATADGAHSALFTSIGMYSGMGMTTSVAQSTRVKSSPSSYGLEPHRSSAPPPPGMKRTFSPFRRRSSFDSSKGPHGQGMAGGQVQRQEEEDVMQRISGLGAQDAPYLASQSQSQSQRWSTSPFKRRSSSDGDGQEVAQRATIQHKAGLTRRSVELTSAFGRAIFGSKSKPPNYMSWQDVGTSPTSSTTSSALPASPSPSLPPPSLPLLNDNGQEASAALHRGTSDINSRKHSDNLPRHTAGNEPVPVAVVAASERPVVDNRCHTSQTETSTRDTRDPDSVLGESVQVVEQHSYTHGVDIEGIGGREKEKDGHVLGPGTGTGTEEWRRQSMDSPGMLQHMRLARQDPELHDTALWKSAHGAVDVDALAAALSEVGSRESTAQFLLACSLPQDQLEMLQKRWASYQEECEEGELEAIEGACITLLDVLEVWKENANLRAVKQTETHRLAESYVCLAHACAHVPDLQIRCLERLSELHRSCLLWAEAGQCLVVVAAIIIRTLSDTARQQGKDDSKPSSGLFLWSEEHLDLLAQVCPDINQLVSICSQSSMQLHKCQVRWGLCQAGRMGEEQSRKGVGVRTQNGLNRAEEAGEGVDKGERVRGGSNDGVTSRDSGCDDGEGYGVKQCGCGGVVARGYVEKGQVEGRVGVEEVSERKALAYLNVASQLFALSGAALFPLTERLLWDVLVPTYVRQRSFTDLVECHRRLAAACTALSLQQGLLDEAAFIPHSGVDGLYYLVKFYGHKLGPDLHAHAYIYREARDVNLAQFTDKLQKGLRARRWGAPLGQVEFTFSVNAEQASHESEGLVQVVLLQPFKEEREKGVDNRYQKFFYDAPCYGPLRKQQVPAVSPASHAGMHTESQLLDSSAPARPQASALASPLHHQQDVQEDIKEERWWRVRTIVMAKGVFPSFLSRLRLDVDNIETRDISPLETALEVVEEQARLLLLEQKKLEGAEASWATGLGSRPTVDRLQVLLRHSLAAVVQQHNIATRLSASYPAEALSGTLGQRLKSALERFLEMVKKAMHSHSRLVPDEGWAVHESLAMAYERLSAALAAYG